MARRELSPANEALGAILRYSGGPRGIRRDDAAALELAETGIAFKVITDSSADLLMSRGKARGKADRVIARGVPHPEGCHPSPAGTAADA